MFCECILGGGAAPPKKMAITRFDRVKCYNRIYKHIKQINQPNNQKTICPPYDTTKNQNNQQYPHKNQQNRTTNNIPIKINNTIHKTEQSTSNTKNKTTNQHQNPKQKTNTPNNTQKTKTTNQNMNIYNVYMIDIYTLNQNERTYPIIVNLKNPFHLHRFLLFYFLFFRFCIFSKFSCKIICH